MHHRRLALSLAAALVVGTVGAGAALAGGPTRISDSYTESFFDDFILDLCGIATTTTLTERWTRTIFPDGSETLHVVRTFVPADPRIPIEKGAGTRFIGTDGTERVTGTPVHLIGQQGGGTTIIDAGWIEFGEEITWRGPHPGFAGDLGPYYCP